jgi:hypothetical protein
MKILDALHKRRYHPPAPREEATSPDAAELPFTGYDKLDDKEVGARLDGLSQVELAAVESFERDHRDRPEVLDKLRYMRTSEPLPGYDVLSPEQIADALASADAETVRAIRDYERKFRARVEVMEAVARVLPTAKASAGEDRADAEKAERVRKGFAVRAKTVRELPK